MVLELLGETYIDGEIRKGSFLYGRESLKMLEGRNIIIWGTGIAADRVTDKLMFRSRNITPYAYCDNNEKNWGKLFHGKSVLSPEEAYCIEKGYFILTVTGKNLDFVIKQIMTRWGDNWSCFFERQMGDYFDTPELMEIVMDSINDVMKRNISRKNLKWYQCVRQSLTYDNLDLIIMSTKFWDNFVNYLFRAENKNYKMLDIGPGYGTFSLIYSHICTGEVSWLSYSNKEKTEIDYIDFMERKYPVKRIYGELQNPDFNLTEQYSLIVFCEVLEHLKYNPVKTIEKIASWLTDDGVIFLSSPTLNGDPCRIYSSYKQMPEYVYMQEKDNINVSNYLDQSEEHSHIYTKEELFELFEQSGLQVIEYKVVYQHHRIILRRKK